MLFQPGLLSSLRLMVLGFAFDHYSRSIIVLGGRFCVLEGGGETLTTGSEGGDSFV